MKKLIIFGTLLTLSLLIAAVIVAEAGGIPILSRQFYSASYHTVTRVVTGARYMEEDDDPPVTCWGDSLTFGFGTTVNHSFPEILTYVFHRKTANEGRSREKSDQIKGRFLNRARSSEPEFVILWAGRNNLFEPEKVESDIAEMVSALNDRSKFLVLGIPNQDREEGRKGGGEYKNVLRINADLRSTYGVRFVDVREKLLESANKRFAKDIKNLADDVVPNSLRSDDLHLNDHGQAIVASAVEEALIANGW